MVRFFALSFGSNVGVLIAVTLYLLTVSITQTIAAVSSLPGGRIVSASWDETLRVWDTTTGQCVMTLEKHSMVCILL